MTVHPTPWAVLPLLAAALAVSVARHVGGLRREPGARALLALAVAGGWWALTQVAVLTFGDPGTQLFLTRLQVAGVVGAPLAWFLFGVAYTGRAQLLRGPLAMAAAVPLVTLVLAWTERGRGLLWEGTRRADVPGGFAVVPGEWWWLNLAWSALLVLCGTGVLVWHHAQSPRNRGSIPLLVVATAAVVLPAAAHLPPVAPGRWIDLTPTGFTLGAAVLAWGLRRQGRMVGAPVARTVVVEEMRDVVVVLDRRGHIVDLNRSAADLLGLELRGPLPLPLGTAWAQEAPRQGTAPGDPRRIPLAVVGGEERAFEVTFTPLGPRGGRGSTVLVMRDVTERERMADALRQKEAALLEANAELERLANTDPLTGLANRRHFMAALASEVERARRYDRPFALVLLDLDHFKGVNDTHGHPAGDRVLKAAGAVLRDVSRDLDLPARVGGEEMALLLPETHAEGARAVAERVRRDMARRRHVGDGGAPFQVTASLGVAVFGTASDDADSLLAAADRALYAAKEAGRDRVVLAPPTGPGFLALEGEG